LVKRYAPGIFLFMQQDNTQQTKRNRIRENATSPLCNKCRSNAYPPFPSVHASLHAIHLAMPVIMQMQSNHNYKDASNERKENNSTQRKQLL
jgi:hypothetical protein